MWQRHRTDPYLPVAAVVDVVALKAMNPARRKIPRRKVPPVMDVHVCAEICAHLDTRDVDILEQLVRGQSNKEIAHKLSLTEQSVKNRIYRLGRKLCLGGWSSRLQLAMAALRGGLVELPSK